MIPEEFVFKLKEIAPDKSVLYEFNYTNERADEFIDSFTCQQRSAPLGIEVNDDSMLQLLDNWDLSKVIIGPVCFHAEPEKLENYLEIGTVEVVKLVYRNDEKDYATVDSQNPTSGVCLAALNGNSLLDGLIELANYITKTAFEEIDIDDQDLAKEYKNKCIAALGGSEYETFCTSVLGV